MTKIRRCADGPSGVPSAAHDEWPSVAGDTAPTKIFVPDVGAVAAAPQPTRKARA